MKTQRPEVGRADRPRTTVRARPTWRRRLDQTLLRWQARLDAAWADRVVPWAGAAGLFVLLYALALARADALGGSVLGRYIQAAWLISSGNQPEPTIGGGHLLAENTPLILWPLGVVTGLLPTVPTLLAAQSASLAVAVVPLWRLGRRVVRLRVGATAALGVAYGLNPAVQNVNLAQFHPQTLAVAPLLAATYFGLVRRWVPFWICAGLGVACAAELGLVVAGLGVLLVLDGSRRHGFRAAIFGVAWTVLAVLVVQPVFGDAALIAPDAFADYGHSVFGVIGAVILHPFQVLGDIFSEADVRVLLGMFAPLLFLPLLAPRYLLPAIPLQVLYLLAAVPLEGPEGAHHLVPLIPFAFVAATFALSRIGRRSVERVLVDRRVVMALVLAAVGFFVLDAASSPYRTPWTWADDAEVDAALEQVVDEVGTEEAVRASPSLLPAFAERRRVYELDMSVPAAGRATRAVTVVVVDDRTVADWTASQELAFVRAMDIRGWRLDSRDQGITVWRKD
jgi:uncharacterized membrane protein